MVKGEEILKTKAEKKSFIFYLSFIFLLLVLIFYFILAAFNQSIIKKINSAQKQLQKDFSPEIKELEKNIKEKEEKIKDFAFLLEKHIFYTKILELIKKYTHPKVLLKKLIWNFEEKNVEFLGESDNFSVLAQQILLLEQLPNLKELALDKVQITKEQKVEFLVKLSFFSKEK